MIDLPYLLVLNVEIRRHRGEFWADPLWHKDLMAHLDNISQLSLFCPVKESSPPRADWRPCAHQRLRIVPCPSLGWLAFFHIPRIVWCLYWLIGEARIVHTGIAGWPWPLGWIAVPLARLRGKFLLVIVESSFWRATRWETTRLARLKSMIFEVINRACVNACDLAFFTTSAYRRQFSGRRQDFGIVAPATWLDEKHVLGDACARMRASSRSGRLLFAGRLTKGKGVEVLMEALRSTSVRVDIVGDGELRDCCVALSTERPDQVRVIDPVTYGDEFFRLIDAYEAVVVPTLSDEQPRIIFDAFARGVPVIASSTSGHVELVQNGQTGWLVPPGDAHALAAAMCLALDNTERSREMGLAALKLVRSRTHRAMHQERADVILKVLEGRYCKS